MCLPTPLPICSAAPVLLFPRTGPPPLAANEHRRALLNAAPRCAAGPFCRSFSPEAVRNMQAALERERVKLYFKVPPGRRSSVLAQLVSKNVMVYEKTILRGL